MAAKKPKRSKTPALRDLPSVKSDDAKGGDFVTQNQKHFADIAKKVAIDRDQ